MNNLDDLEGEDFADNEEIDGTPEAYHAEVSTNPVNVTTLGEEYDYDVETNLNSFFWDELLPTLIVYSLTFILGLVGNILIIFTTFRYRKMKSTTNVFLASLASADLLLIVFCIPVKSSAFKSFLGTRHKSGKNYSKYRESLRESQTVRHRLHDSFLRCWTQAHGPIELTKESRDLVPLTKAEIIGYDAGENHGKVVRLKKQSKRKQNNLDLRHPLLHPFLDEAIENTQDVIGMNGKALVIYRRDGRRRINDWKNYQFQQVAIAKAKLGLHLGEKIRRSSSETRERLSSRQMCITRSRRSKIHCEPVRFGRSVSIEFKKFDEIREMFHPEESNSVVGQNGNENAFLWKSNEFRLRSTAEKKLNLFKEMKKSERQRRKKFQETIARSLNQRCADIESFSIKTINSKGEALQEEDGNMKATPGGNITETVENVFDLPFPKTEEEERHKESSERESSASASGEDNAPMMADCSNTSREPSKQLVPYKLRDIADKLVTVEEIAGEKSRDSQRGDSSTCNGLMKLLGTEGPKNPDLKELKLKLKTTLKNSNEVLPPEETKFYARTTISELLTPNDIFLDTIIPPNVPPIIVYPTSAARRLRRGSGSYKINDENELKTISLQKSVGHECGTREKLKSNENSQRWLLNSSREAEHLVMTNLVNVGSSDTELSKIFDSTVISEESSRNSGKITTLDKKSKAEMPRKTLQLTKSSGRNPDNLHPSRVPSWAGRAGHTKAGRETSDRCVERKILKLEYRLKEMLRRIGMCPPSDRIAIKKCLERLRETSEAVLKRLRTERFDSCQRYCGGRGDTLDIIHRGYHSEPDSAVRVNADKRPLILKTSGSEIQINVGMEITMENFDPVTGKKLLPEENRDFEQKGNIQCKLVKPGEKPVTFIDTDFMYNPRTGMLFQRGHTTDRYYRSKEYKEPLSSTKAYLLPKMTKRNFPGDTNSESSGKKSETGERGETLQNSKSIKYRGGSSSPETSKSALADAFRIAIEREETKNVRHLQHGRETSRSFPMEKPRCTAKHCKQKNVWLKPAAKTSQKQGVKGVSAQGIAKIVEARTQQTYHLQERLEGDYTDAYREGITMQTFMVSDKGTQTNLGPRWKTWSESVPKRSMGVQAEVKNRGKVLVSRSADTTFLGTPLWALRRGVNVCVQTSSAQILPGLRRGSDASSQTDFLMEEAQKYMKDLETQKRLAKLFSYTWTFGFFICKLVYYMQSVSAICSVLTLTAMSVERYYAIVHPMRAQYVCTISQARRIITFTWISSLFLAIPVLFAQIHMPVGVRVKGFWCVRDYDNPTIWRAHETYMLLLILIIPTGVMGVAYTTICLEIWQVMQRRQDLTSAKILNIRYNKTSINCDSFSMYGKEKKQQRNTYGESPDDEAHVKQVIKMLVAVVVIYVVCWAPLLIDNILQAYGVLPFMKFGKQKYMATAFHLMAYFNSCINPIVYGFMSKNFRESFHKTLCCTTRKGHASMRNTSMSHDRNTSIRYAESRRN